jgi:hypothetical protein
MAERENLDIIELVGKKEFDAYQNYILLTSYENIISNGQQNGTICDDYTTRDFSYPMDIYIKGN